MHLNSLRAKILKILNINKRINAKFKTSCTCIWLDTMM